MANNNKNMIYRILVLFVGSLCLLSATFGALTDSLYVHHEFENDATDSSINGRDGTLNAGSYTTGKIGNGILIDASTEYFTFATLTDIYNIDVSFCAWVDSTDNTNYLGYATNTGHGGTNNVLNIGTNSNKIGYYDGTWRNSATSSVSGEHFYCWVFDDSENKFEPYLDGVNLGNVTYGGLIDFKGVFSINRNGATDIDATIDEFSIWDRKISADEISQLYNSGSGLAFADWNPTGTTPTINHNVSTFYNSENISIALTTATNTNMSYYLDAGSEVTICSDCNSTTLNLNSLSEGSHSILFESTDLSGQVNTTANFTIDLTAPNSSNNILAEYNSYSINFNSSCNDLNLVYCNISLNNQTVALNSSSFTFTQNGNFSYNITAVDQAGNTFLESGFIFINPTQKFYFQQENGSFVEDFYFNNTFYNEFAAINIYDLGLGNHTLEFSKSGFGRVNITFNFNLTSNINLTSAVLLSRIYVKVYDRDTQTLINTKVDLTLEGDSFGKVFNTTNGTYTILETAFVPGDYILSAEKDGYARAEQFFTYTGYETATIKLYMLNNTADNIVTVRRTVIDQNNVRLGGVLVKVMQYDPATSGYLYVDSGTTNTNGDVVYDLEYNSKTYKFIFTYDDITKEESKNKITIFGLENPLYYKFDTSEAGISNYDYITNLEYDVTFNEINTSNSSGYFKFIWNDLDGHATKVCLELEKNINNRYVAVNETCNTLATGILNTWVYDYNVTEYRTIGYVYYESEKIPLETAYSSPTGNKDAWESLGSMGLIAVLFFTLITAGLGFMIRPSLIFLGPIVIWYFARKINMFKMDDYTFWSLVIILAVASWLIEKFNKENS